MNDTGTSERLAFLCHSSEDKEQVRDLYHRLSNDGITCWFDEEDLLPGQDWDQKIRKALRDCRYVLVCLSKSSISKTGYVQRELKRALDLADEQPEDTVYLIPVRLEPCEVPERLQRWHWVDLFGSGGYQRLLRAVRSSPTEDTNKDKNRILRGEASDGRAEPRGVDQDGRRPKAARPPDRSGVSLKIIVPALGAVLLLLVVIGLWGGLRVAGSEQALPQPTSQPASPAPAVAPDVLDWESLPPFRAKGATLFEQPLVTPVPNWPTGHSDAADLEFRDGAYLVQPLNNNLAKYITAPAPADTFVADAVVSATATLRSGQGLWGVWCRGAAATPGDAYLFLISHTAAIQITRTGFEDGTGWKHLDGVDVSQPVTISARCADVPGAPVELTMAVNGRQALSYRPAKALSPGYYGITAQPFSDVEGPIAEEKFTDFRVSLYN